MTQVPNPFDQSDSNSLKRVIDAASEIISGEPTLPDDYGSHVDAAATEICKADTVMMQDDLTKIMQKHFNNASQGDAKRTNLQTTFQKEVGKKMQQAQNNARWEEH
jgi:hypothetical protein